MTDTIAAVATASGGGVGIVRLSGPRAEEIVRALCPQLGSLPSHQLVLAKVRDGDEVLDEVLAVVMRAPRSYTGENVAELHAHGGAANLSRILRAVLARGARLADPGEFTRRAVVAGKLDLTQAEAIAAVIGARDERSLRAAHAIRMGALGTLVARARKTIIATLAELEGALDFPDEVPSQPAPVAELEIVARELRASAEGRRVATSVPEVVLVGAVNAGKSSLFNALCGEERALVDPAPGTTRDVVEAEVRFGAIVALVLDTAGLRAEPSDLERRGQALADRRRATASLTLHIVDGSRGWSSEDDAFEHHGPVLVVENKADLAMGAGEVAPTSRGKSDLATRGRLALEDAFATRDQRGQDPAMRARIRLEAELATQIRPARTPNPDVPVDLATRGKLALEAAELAVKGDAARNAVPRNSVDSAGASTTKPAGERRVAWAVASESNEAGHAAPAGDGETTALRVSARTGDGIDALRQSIESQLQADGPLLASLRQADELTRAADAVELALSEIGYAPEVAALELRRSLAALGALTGETVDTAVLDELFSRFCIGK